MASRVHDGARLPVVKLSVIVPFHQSVGQLERCLGAVRASSVEAEIIVVSDGAAADANRVAMGAGAALVAIQGPRGPAVARNRGAEVAHGDVLVFVDSDVLVHADALERIREVLASRPDVAAVFGAYDDRPEASGLVSRCKNLSHAYIHQRSRADATTFWAGLGAVRAGAFRRVGGFDERFRRPSVEDIDLGYRLTAAGFRIRLDPAIQGTHLKRWTLWTALRTDIRDRGIPWTQLLHRYGGMRNDLNLTWRYRAAVVLAYLGCAALGAALWQPAMVTAALGLFAAIAWLDREHYGFLARHGGLPAAACWFPLHVAHHLGNGVAFAAGSVLHAAAASPWAGRAGALPRTPWEPFPSADEPTVLDGWSPARGLHEAERHPERCQ